MASYRRESILPSLSDDDSEEEGLNSSKRKNVDEIEDYHRKRKKIENKVSMPRFSTSSSISSRLGSTSSSEGDSSPNCFGPVKNFSMGLQNEESFSSDSQEVGTNFSNKAKKMMMSMGYEKGKGLGKFQQGIVAPISASLQRGRRGLGFIIQGLEPMENLKWDKEKETIIVEEEVFWLPQNNSEPPDLSILSSWPQEGPKKKDISDETKFCHPKILKEVLSSKSVFDNLSEKELFKGRSRSNPFETIGKLFFQNRAALKMANIDSVFNFMFTRPVDEEGHSLIGSEELLYFADVCAAPGGFSEYVLWRRKTDLNGFCDAKGFGFTLKENDFKLHDFFAAPSEFFEPHYGVSGQLGDGNIYDPDNIKNFRNFILKSTGGKGVHFMMADGGFSVEGQENIQEILSKQLYLCQFLVALGIIRIDGHFVCKLFDIFTPFSVGLVYLMYRCFKVVCIHKPNSSRPANSERYIICKWKKSNIEDVYEYLFELNLRLRGFASSADMDVVEIVPTDILEGDKQFYEYIYESNNVFGEKQVIGLQKIKAFCQDLSLFEDRQANLRNDCLSFWQLPDRSRMAPARMEAKVKAVKLLGTQEIEILGKPPVELSMDTLANKIHTPYDYRFVMLASPKDGLKDRSFYLGLGGCNVFRWNGKDRNGWHRVDLSINLPPDTVVYGEIVTEHRGELKTQRKYNAFHLIDALFLNGFDVRCMHLVERHGHLKKFAMAVNKESRNDLTPIRCKKLYKLEEIECTFQMPILSRRVMKGSAMPKRVFCESEAADGNPARYTIPSGILLLKTTQNPWMMAYSKSSKRKYWFNTQTRESIYECRKEAIAPLSVSYCEGAFWWWVPGVKILETDDAQPKKLHYELLLDHINRTK